MINLEQQPVDILEMNLRGMYPGFFSTQRNGSFFIGMIPELPPEGNNLLGWGRTYQSALSAALRIAVDTSMRQPRRSATIPRAGSGV
jgi:hypothetical protein